MKHFDINTPFKGNGWYKVKVKDKTMSQRYPWIPSWSKMLRLAAKSGR